MNTTNEHPGSGERGKGSRVAGNVRKFPGAKPPVDPRKVDERRVRLDRREMIRFEDDRRTSHDRRADGDAWRLF